MANYRHPSGKGGYRGRSEGSGFGRDRASEVFSQRRPEGNRYGGGKSFERRTPLEMHDAVCAKCGKQTKVPFKPTTGGRPVFCSDCFRKDSGPAEQRREPSAITSEQLDIINRKLDRIMKALNL